MKKLATLLLCGTMALSMLAGCATPPQEAETQEPGQVAQQDTEEKVFTYAAQFTYNMYDPAVDWVGWDVLKAGGGEMLVKFNADGGVEPWLAESWSVADDGLTWTFKLREDVTFSNGEAMTATKVKESIQRLYDIQNPENGGGGYAHANFTYSSLVADDQAYTITLVTDEPTPDLPECMGFPWLMIVDAAACEGRDTDREGAITTGPYMLDKVEPGISESYIRNENYWNGTPYFDENRCLIIAETSLTSMALAEKSIDFAGSLLADDIAYLADVEGVEIAELTTPRIQYLNFNMEGIMGNDTLRKAINMAIDGETIAKNVTQDTYTYGFSSVPDSLGFGYEELTNPYAYDLDAAIALLDAEGIVDTDGDGIRELDGENIQFTVKTAAARMADIISQAQAANITQLGFEVDVQIVEDASIVLRNGDYDICAYTWMVANGGDPGRYLSRWYSKAPDNDARYQNDRYDEIYSKLLTEFDPDVRYDYIVELQQILLDDAVIVSAGYMNYVIGHTDKLVGDWFTPSNLYWVTNEMAFAD